MNHILPSLNTISFHLLNFHKYHEISSGGGKVTKIPDRPGEPRVSKADIRKIKTKLRWKPQIQFKQGIENMLKDIKKWKNAPLWTPSKIKKVTAEWFSYLK